MGWIGEVPKNLEKYQGFVYLIRNNKNQKCYIGRKYFWSKKVRQPLKGRKNKRHYRIESDWKDYWGSSDKFKEYVDKKGKDKFRRIMIHHCKNKFEMAYWEADTQFDWAVLFDKNSFNEVINLRIRKNKGDIDGRY